LIDPPAEPVALVTSVERNESRSLRILRRSDYPAEPVVAALRDPSVFLVARKKKRSKKKERRRARRKRLVGSREVDLAGQRRKVFVKLYRVRSVKDWFEELIAGKRAVRAFRAGLEAERRGIAVPPHLGAAYRDGGFVAAHRPGDSTLLMLGLSTRRDAREVLKYDLGKLGLSRSAFLARIGEFCADLHRRGLAHGDLKAGNLIVVRRDPLAFALLDLDRTSFRPANRQRLDLKDAIDLYRLLQSLRRDATKRERQRLLAVYRRARGLARFARFSIAFAIATRFAR